MPKVTWDDYFMGLAKAARVRSSCSRRQVGAVAVVNGRVVATGYNGTPTHMKDCMDGGCQRCAGPTPSGTGLSRCLCVHAEANVVAMAARHGVTLNYALVYTTHSPCLDCAKLLLNSGVSNVVFNADYPMEEWVREQFAGHLYLRAVG